MTEEKFKIKYKRKNKRRKTEKKRIRIGKQLRTMRGTNENGKKENNNKPNKL